MTIKEAEKELYGVCGLTYEDVKDKFKRKPWIVYMRAWGKLRTGVHVQCKGTFGENGELGEGFLNKKEREHKTENMIESLARVFRAVKKAIERDYDDEWGDLEEKVLQLAEMLEEWERDLEDSCDLEEGIKEIWYTHENWEREKAAKAAKEVKNNV